MTRRARLDLTEHEAETLAELLGMVLSNGDQWAFMDLLALNRVDNKVNQARAKNHIIEEHA